MAYLYREIDTGYEERIEAHTLDEAREIAEQWLRDGDWNMETAPKSIIVEADVITLDAEGDELDEERVEVRIDPPEPPCTEEEHDWQSPQWLGGLAENPGVFGHGGGVIIHEVCAHCGWYRIRNTWDQDSPNGDPVETLQYREPDEQSREWVDRCD